MVTEVQLACLVFMYNILNIKNFEYVCHGGWGAACFLIVVNIMNIELLNLYCLVLSIFCVLNILNIYTIMAVISDPWTLSHPPFSSCWPSTHVFIHSGIKTLSNLVDLGLDLPSAEVTWSPGIRRTPLHCRRPPWWWPPPWSPWPPRWSGAMAPVPNWPCSSWKVLRHCKVSRNANFKLFLKLFILTRITFSALHLSLSTPLKCFQQK